MHYPAALLFLLAVVAFPPQQAGAETLNFSGRLAGEQSLKSGREFLLTKSGRQIFGWIGSSKHIIIRGSLRGNNLVRARL